MSRQRVFNKMLAEIPWDGAELANPLTIGALSVTNLTISGTLSLPANSISSTMLAADSVTSAKIAPNTIVAADMASGAAAGNVGTLGGVLGGTLPNPTMAAGAAATNVGSLSGVLTGTLPNPGMAAGAAATNVGTLSGVLTGSLPAPGMAVGAAVTNVGTLGGVLGGTLPNPTMAAGAAAANVGTVGGVLTGTLPNPGMAANAVGTTQINNLAVTSGKMASGAAATNVGTLSGVLTGTLPSPGMATDAVGTAQIQNGAVTAGKLAPGAGLVDPLTLENGLTVNAPATMESLALSSKAVNVSPDAGNAMAWNINGFYVPQVVERFTAAYYYVATTTMVNPGPGNFRTNTTGTPGAVTQVAINDLDDTGRDMSAVIRSMQVGDQIYAQVEDNASKWSRVTLTALPADQGAWWLLNVEDAGYESPVTGGSATSVTFIIGGSGGGGGAGDTAADTEEFLPAAAATTLTLGRTPSDILMVMRDGMAQSYADGHWTVADSTLTFTDAFNGTERVLVTYTMSELAAAGPMGPSAGVHEEFMPANLATAITLSQACQSVLLVARNGVVQSATSGNYSVAGNVLTFTDAFNGSERVVVEYAQQTVTAAPPFNGSGLVDGSVTSAKIADGTIVAGDLANDSVTTPKLANAAVTRGKLAVGAAQTLVGNTYTEYTFSIVPGAWTETSVFVDFTSSGGVLRFDWQALVASTVANNDIVLSFGIDGNMTWFHVARFTTAIAGNTTVSGVIYDTSARASGTHRASVWAYSGLAGASITNAGKSGIWVTEQAR